ncbi:unnamed protein product, partial [Soboliphyme baturini]|uniref:Coiled-coil domain-containing protein 176 n=1 Tax=Soboliphyme baturini TaxID=241478 RepID=A0A183JAM6_9BILA
MKTFFRKDLEDAKAMALDRVSHLERQCQDYEAKATETDENMQAMSKVMSITQETERELKLKLEHSSSEKQKTQERLFRVQEELMNLERLKRSQDIAQMKCERKNAFLTASLSEMQAERDRLKKILDTMNKDRAALDKAISMIEVENMELHNA